MEDAVVADLWGYTADLIYLTDHSGIRDAFYSPEVELYYGEQAKVGDQDTIFRIIAKYEGPEAARALEYWWTHAPEIFYVVKDGNHQIIYFYIVFNPREMAEDLMQKDPLIAAWLEHLSKHPVPEDQDVLFFRRSLAEGTGEIPLEWAGVGICWLEMVWTFLNNPRLRKLYIPFRHSNTTELTPLDYQEVPELSILLDRQTYRTYIHDFGPNLVFGFFKELVTSIGKRGEADCLLDLKAHQLVLHGKGIKLTPLEFGVMKHLNTHVHRAIPREELIREVWGYEEAIGSNVVDSIVRSLRKKLGELAPEIETVSGVGYKFRGFQDKPQTKARTGE